MKIGVFIHNVPPEEGGGYTIQWDIFQAFIELAEESKHKFVIFCSHKNIRQVSSVVKNKSIPIAVYKRTLLDRFISLFFYEIPVFRRRWKTLTKLERLARKHEIKFMWYVGAGGFILDTIPYLTIVYDLTHRVAPWFPEVSFKGIWASREIFYSWFLRRASFIITGTKVGKEEIERFYQIPSERIKILPHPTPSFCLNKDRNPDKSILTKYTLLPNSYLLYPAQFWTHKNHINLLLAVKILREEYNLNFSLVFVGSDKGNLEYVKEYTKQIGLTSQVYSLGFVLQEDLVSLYQNAFALTYMSLCGPENLPPLEAFALGCPVIASDIPGAREQLEDAALLVDPLNPAQIAFAIKQIYDNSELRKQLIEKGFKRATKWTAKDFVYGVFRIFDEFEPIRKCWD
jgi:glycosyltransferase involved in cell wall biosynthesis